jgi:hypothetical protein
MLWRLPIHPFSVHRCYFSGVKLSGHDVDQSRIVARLRMSGAIPLLSLPLWRGQGQLLLFSGPYRYSTTGTVIVRAYSSWNVMAHGDAREGKWRGNWRMEWVASTLHTTSEHDVSSITTADTHTSAVSSRLNWRPRRFKWTHPFRRKTKSSLYACAITFQLVSTAFFMTYP